MAKPALCERIKADRIGIANKNVREKTGGILAVLRSFQWNGPGAGLDNLSGSCSTGELRR